MIAVKCLEEFAVEATGAWTRFPVRVDFRPMIGYLPVYENLAEARKDYPDAPDTAFMEITFVKKAKP